ncbi:hypothetical protein B0H21DRAFT_704124, partial [Amylocystis lapponica]
YVGVSLGDTSNHRLALADNGERIFSDNLFGVQIGDRPNLYGDSASSNPLGPYRLKWASLSTDTDSSRRRMNRPTT